MWAGAGILACWQGEKQLRLQGCPMHNTKRWAAPADQPKAAFEAQVPDFSISVCYQNPKWQLCRRNAAAPGWELPRARPRGCSHGLHLPCAWSSRAQGIRNQAWELYLQGCRFTWHLPCSLQRPCPSSICFPQGTISRPGDATSLGFFFFVLCRACNSTFSTVLTLASSCACVRFSGPSSRLPCGSI